MSAWDGLPVDIEFQGQRFTAFVTIEILEDLAEIAPETHRSLQDYLRIFDHYRGAILDDLRVAFERGVTWSRDHQQLRVRTIDVRDLVPNDDWDQLVIANPKVMGGMPVFAGSRVPIEIVLSSLKAGVDLEELKLSYPFLTPAHVEAARAYELEHPRVGTRVSSSPAPSAWKTKSRSIARRISKE
jgi:uncharacterized protein (DUF433 family)